MAARGAASLPVECLSVDRQISRSAYRPRMSKKQAQRKRDRSRTMSGRRQRGMKFEVFHGPPLGPGMETTDVATVMAALERFDPELSWKQAQSRVLPMLPRIRPLPVQELDLARTMLPPGILVGFGIDLGPAITFVSTTLVERWQVDPPTLAQAALANVRQRADSCGRDQVVESQIADVPVRLLQSRVGIAASLLLAPDCLERFFGSGPSLLLAPMRDLLVALPADVDREFAAWLAEEWEALDPNHLHLGGFRYERGVVVVEPLDAAFARA